MPFLLCLWKKLFYGGKVEKRRKTTSNMVDGLSHSGNEGVLGRPEEPCYGEYLPTWLLNLMADHQSVSLLITCLEFRKYHLSQSSLYTNRFLELSEIHCYFYGLSGISSNRIDYLKLFNLNTFRNNIK